MTARVNEPLTPTIYRTIDVYRHLSAKPIQFVCQTPWYFGFHTHRYENRTVGCPGELVCRLCKTGEQKRWSGAIIASRMNGTSAKLLMFTQSCVKEFQEANHPETGLTHRVFKMWRKNDDPRSELRCEFVGVANNLERLWTMESLVHHVDRIFKSSSLAERRQGKEAKQ